MSKYIVTAEGGLGNQIMAYALWYYLRKNNKSILYLKRNEFNKAFPFSDITVSQNRLMDMYIYFYKRYNAYIVKKFKINGFLKRLLGIVIDYPEWCDYLFLANIQTELKQCLVFAPDHNKKNIELIKYIQECNSVSIHVRRGDYQNNAYWRIMLGDICDEVYYSKALDEVLKIINTPVYFIFSDDILWVKDTLKISNAIYIDWNVGEEAYRDIQLMSYCKINILANSSFSLSAAWLNVNPNPIRIAPFKWSNSYNDDLSNKCVPKNWIIINNKIPMVSIIIKEEVSEKTISFILKQNFTDYEIIYLNDKYNNIDARINSNQPIGKFHYNFNSHIDSNKFKSRSYLHIWLSDVLQKDIIHTI